MKSRVTKLLAVTIVLAIGAWIFFSRQSKIEDEKVEEERLQTEQKLRIQMAISDMTRKFNAVTDWKNVFEKKDDMLWTPIYTIQVQQALLETQHRPILFHASLDDVFKQGDQYLARFVSWSYFPMVFHFELECTSEQAKRLIKNPTEMFANDYAIIAHIRNVCKPTFAVKPYPTGNEEAEVEIETSDVFLATGECLDFLYVGDLLSDEGGSELLGRTLRKVRKSMKKISPH